MKFSGLTKKGRAYLAKCQASSTPIQFTKMKFGDGKLIDNENPADLIDIKNIKIEKSILSKEQKGDAVVLTTVIDNVSLEEGYFPRETGIYVLDEGVEVLYFYMNDGDETSWIPPEADGPHRMEVKINLISSNTGSVVVHNDGKDLYITKEYLEANYTQKGEYDGTAQEIEDRVVAAVGKEDGKFPLTESIVGNVYYFPGNKKFYICKTAENRKVSVPNGNFEELSIWENRKRLENLITFTSNGSYQNTFNGNLSNIGIFTYQSSSSVDTGNKIHMKYIAPQGYEILTASVFWKDNLQETDYIGFDYERTNTEITVVYSTNKMSRSYTVTLFCKKLN